MKFQTLMIMKAVVCLSLGALILAVPDFTYSLFGITLGAGGEFAAREYGAALMGNLMVTWFAKNAAASTARWAIVLGLCVYDAIGFVVALLAMLSGLMNPLGWSIVALYLFFAVGYGYFLIKSPETKAQERMA